MITKIKTTCPSCGEVTMSATEVVLFIELSYEHGTYRFICPQCARNVEKDADQTIINLLTSAGVVIEFKDHYGTDGNWDLAFINELSCDGTHKWDFPVKMGQKCVCGEKKWEK
jgi:predicted RNA-binding Zn-ribbon protein involved in translation (DUF1610 family)